MASDNVWKVLRSLLDGAVASGTVDAYVPVESEQDVPLVFYVRYRAPGSADCENLNAEIQSFGYEQTERNGSDWKYEIPTQKAANVIPDPVRRSKIAARARVVDEIPVAHR